MTTANKTTKGTSLVTQMYLPNEEKFYTKQENFFFVLAVGTESNCQ